MGGGERGTAITGSDEGERERALLAAMSFMSETEKDSQRRK